MDGKTFCQSKYDSGFALFSGWIWAINCLFFLLENVKWDNYHIYTQKRPTNDRNTFSQRIPGQDQVEISTVMSILMLEIYNFFSVFKIEQKQSWKK